MPGLNDMNWIVHTGIDKSKTTMSEIALKCTICGSWIDEEDLFCANCGTEAPHTSPVAAAADAASLVTDNFKCQSCGAAMSYDASGQSLRCPFCGSLDMKSQPDHKVLTPRSVAPFRLNREEAVAAMRDWLGKGFWRPGGLAEQACVVKMTPVYVPYWVFQANTHTYWTADTNQTPPSARGDWYPLSGEHKGSYSGMLIGASGALSPAETQAICPFDFAPAVSPDKVDLKNAIEEEFSRPKKYARPLACEVPGRPGNPSLHRGVCAGHGPQCTRQRADYGHGRRAGAFAGLDNGLSIPRRTISILGQRAKRAGNWAGAALHGKNLYCNCNCVADNSGVFAFVRECFWSGGDNRCRRSFAQIVKVLYRTKTSFALRQGLQYVLMRQTPFFADHQKSHPGRSHVLPHSHRVSA